LRIKDLKDGTIQQYVAESGFPKNARVMPEDIIYTRTGQIGLVFRGAEGVLHNNCFKVSPGNEISGSYLFWWLQHMSFKNKIIALASRMAQPDITHTLFKAQQIAIPPENVQSAAVERIEALYDYVCGLEAAYRKKFDDLAELRQSILQKAFAGELTAYMDLAA
jgi:type I restriction enzyme S subunit